MEFSSSNYSSDGSSSECSEESDSSQRTDNSLLTATVKKQSLGNHVALNASTGLRTTNNLHPKISRTKHSGTDTQVQRKQEKGARSDYPRFVETTQLQEETETVITRTKSVQLNNDVHAKPVQQQNSTSNLLLQGSELLQLNNQIGLSLTANDQLVSLAPPALDLNFGDGLLKTTVVEQTAKFVDSQKVINDLETHNSKLVEEKTKLSVQLGIQTKVCNSNNLSDFGFH